MRLHGKQAFANFLAAATVASTSQFFVSARIGGGKESTSKQQQQQQQQHRRRAPIRQGYDPTAPGVRISSSIESSQPTQKQPRRRSSSYLDDHHYDRPGSKSIDDALRMKLHPTIADEVLMGQVDYGEDKRIRNATTTTTNTTNTIATAINNMNLSTNCFNHPDTGVLICPSSSPSGTPTTAADSTTIISSKSKSKSSKTISTTADTKATTTTKETSTTTPSNVETTGGCLIGYYGDFGEIVVPVPANEYLHNHVSKDAPEGFGIIFDSVANTVYCNQDYDVDTGDYACAFLTFKGCDVKCNGKKSCFDSIIEDATKIECLGIESCDGAHLDANFISCAAEGACQSSHIGEQQLVQTLDCHSYCSCEAAKVYQVNDVSCSGPLACYHAQISGVESKVTCQSSQSPDEYYQPTCGGENAFIEAADNKNIDVVCSGDFSCTGYGHDAYDHMEHPIYFDIDVGKKGELICENSLEGNHDGGTYVCRYIDIIQGCANYECHEPTGFTEVNDYRTCNHIFSVHHHELCYEGNLRRDMDNDDDDDNDDNYDNDDNDVNTARTW